MADYLTSGFSTLEHLTLDIHLLEANGIVRQTKQIKTFGYRRYLDYLGKMSFNSRLDLSEDIVAIAFSYSGRVTQGDGTGVMNDEGVGRVDWDFWKVPRRNPPK